MPEKIQLHPLNPAEHFAIAAAVLADAVDATVDRKLARAAAGDPTWSIEVELRVEGIEVPFAATIAEIYRRMEARIDERAAAIAYDAAKLKGLEKLQAAIARADWEIRQKIEEVFGVQLRDD